MSRSRPRRIRPPSRRARTSTRRSPRDGESCTDQGLRMTEVVATRPVPGTPRAYEFPPFSRTRLSNFLSLLTVDLPGRPLVSASLILPNGAGDEPADDAGATVLAARALS